MRKILMLLAAAGVALAGVAVVSVGGRRDREDREARPSRGRQARQGGLELPQETRQGPGGVVGGGGEKRATDRGTQPDHTASPADRDQSLAVIRQAILAHGGEDRLAKARLVVRSEKGSMSFFDKDSPCTREVVLDLPERGRWVWELDPGDRKVQLIVAVTGGKGWRSGPEGVNDLSAEALGEIRDEAYAEWVMTLLPLKEKVFELSPLPEAKVNGQPALGVKVSQKDQPDIKLFFDKGSGLLVKFERRGREAGVAVDKETIFSDHQDSDGIRMARKRLELMDGKKMLEATECSYKFPGKPEESVFVKP